MGKPAQNEEGLTVKKEGDFSEWYTQVVQKAGLADYSPVKGCMIIRPLGYALWENIQRYFDARLKTLKVQNAYFPLFVPEEFFTREKKHAEGFTPEVAWIANTDENGMRLAIRPTSETIIYDAYAKWIRSHRDLPMRINQWGNVVRWETKATRLFLRTREFLWQEGHCAYATKEECTRETRLYLEEYKKLCEDLLAIPVLSGTKTDMEKFAGADYTLSIEALMPNGKALQMGTSHNLGQGFATSFNITFLGEDEKRHTPWQNSWGISTRLIGAVVMMHGDDKGLIIPPRLAPMKGVIIPILFENTKDKVLALARKLASELHDVHVDDREEYTPGWKYNEWELKGVPIRMELGPKDLEKKQVILVRRDTGKKTPVPTKDLKKVFKETLEDIHKNLFTKAQHHLKNSIIAVKSKQEFEKTINANKIAYASFCGQASCEKKIKEHTGATSRCIPFEPPHTKETACAYCNTPATTHSYFAKAY